ncbi:MAG: hypothetical protein ACPG7F_03155 [Aggregatilineales bacterium]
MKTQNYPYRWLVKCAEIALVMGIVIFSFDAIHDFFSPTFSSDVSYSYEAYYSDNNAAHTLYWEARRQVNAENYTDAFVYYSEAITEDRNYAAPYLGRGLLQEQRGDYSAAAEDFYHYMMYTHTSHRRKSYTPLNDDIQTKTVTLTMREGHIFSIPINIMDGETLTINADSNTADPIVVLMSPDGEIVTGSDDSYTTTSQDNVYRQFESMNAAIPATTLAETGTYILLVSHAGGGSEGDVTVAITATQP